MPAMPRLAPERLFAGRSICVVAGHYAFEFKPIRVSNMNILLGSAVLGFVEDDKCVVRKCDRAYTPAERLQCLARNCALHFLRLSMSAARHKRTQIRRDLLFQVTREKSVLHASFYGWTRQTMRSTCSLSSGGHRHRHREICLAGAGCPIPKTMSCFGLLRRNCVAGGPRDDWHLRGEVTILVKRGRQDSRRFGYRVQSVIEFVFLNVHTFLARFLKLLKDMLRFVDPAWFPLQFHPTFAGGHLHAKRIFQRFQELEIVCVKRLQSARALKLESACFSHLPAQ